jgi:hypothetical protein
MLHRLLATAAWTAFALIVFSTISPLSMRPVATADPNIERFAAFALLGFLFGLAYPRRLAVDATFRRYNGRRVGNASIGDSGPARPHGGRARQSGRRGFWRGGGGSNSFGRGRTSQGPGEAMNHPSKGTNLSPRSLIEFPTEHANG